MSFKFFLLGSLSLLPSVHTQGNFPTLELPWGTYQAQYAPHDDQIYLFQDVRFGAEPVRFGESQFPQGKNSSIQPPPPNTDCLQINPSILKNPPGGKSRLGDPNQDLGPGDADSAAPAPPFNGVEDCLFLDIYVPVSVFDQPPPQPLPVNVWFYGGAYAFGTKKMSNGPLYSGRSLLKASGYKTILVAGNYRLGALGWLAGSYMEQNGLPNAGLYDQNLLLQWVQEYIVMVHGDNTSVSAWGESAGAGSILHHLIRNGGKEDPLFRRFVAQSPAFEWAWDNSPDGQLDKVYQSFASSVGCPAPYNIDCLRDPSITSDQLGQANVQLFKNVKQTGLFPIGPAVDNNWIKTIPTLAFSQGKFWPNIKSAIISHCGNDAQRFTPTSVNTNGTFYNFLNMFLPGTKLASLPQKIANKYDCQGQFGGNYFNCLRQVIRDISFTCNTRDLIDAYPQQAYAMSYGFPNHQIAYHATDLIPLFMNNDLQLIPMLNALQWTAGQIATWSFTLANKVVPSYLKYFASFALQGNPNSAGETLWPVVNTSGPLFSNVMDPSAGVWTLINDTQNTADTCSFWNGIAQDIVDAQGNSGERNDVHIDEEDQEEL